MGTPDKRMLVRAVALLTAAASCSLGMPRLCLAQVQLPTVNLGLTSFEDGLSPTGWFFDVYPDFYNADNLKDSRGNTVPGRNRLTANSLIGDAIYVSQNRIFGGWLTYVAFLPWVDLDVKLANGLSSRVRGLADFTGAAGLQWATVQVGNGLFGQRLMFPVSVPTGKYSDEQPVNLGNHCVSFNPYYAFTYEHGKVEFSARIHYLWNSVNHDPYVEFGVNNVQAGQAFHMNYAVSYEVVKNVRVGFNGYWLQQLTDHKINGVNVPGSLERTVGLGGGIRIFAGHNTWFFLHGYSETDVRNRAEGYSVILRVVKAIPSENTGG
jgi:hypothetical protein